MSNIRDREFIGRGLSFPLQITPRGGIGLTRGTQEIEQSIRVILGTMPGERVRRPEFGCRAYELLFEPRNAATKSQLAYYVQEALRQWEPRINLVGVEVTEDSQTDGALLVEIKYAIKDTHDERSIVYPFYLAGEEDEG